MLIPDILNIVAEYCDLSDYENLKLYDPNIISLEKYQERICQNLTLKLDERILELQGQKITQDVYLYNLSQLYVDNIERIFEIMGYIKFMCKNTFHFYGKRYLEINIIYDNKRGSLYRSGKVLLFTIYCDKKYEEFEQFEIGKDPLSQYIEKMFDLYEDTLTQIKDDGFTGIID